MLFPDIHEGLSRSFQVEISEAMLDAFAQLSGDTNSIHMDAAAALKHGFKNRVGHGMLTASFYSTLVGMHLPGENALLHTLNIQFTLPVYPGDSLTVTGTVSHINEPYGYIEIKARIRNQQGSTVSRAIIRVGMVQ